MMFEDPIVAEVRKTREYLAGQFNFDVHAIFKDLQQRQVLLGARLVRIPHSRNSKNASRLGESKTAYHSKE